MNLRLLSFFCFFPMVTFGNNGCGHTVRFTVANEQGLPIEGATISVTYQTGFIPGEGFGRDITKTIRKETDLHGVATFHIKPFGDNTFGYGVRDHKGRYYRDIGERKAEIADGDSITERKVTLRRKQEPISLLFPECYSMYFPVSNNKALSLREPVGFDAVIGDWIAPHGKGKIADFIFRSRYEENGTPYVKNSFGVLEFGKDFRYTAAFSWTFANEDDGIIEAPKLWPTSELPVEREAPIEGYSKEFRLEWHRPKAETDFNGDYKRQYFFRIRTQQNHKGEIVYAFYGKLTQIPRFGNLDFDWWQCLDYCLNLTPMDRNLEYSGENLKENMVLRTHVNADYIRRFPSVLLNQDNYLRSLPTLAEEERKKTSAQAEP